MTHRIYQFGTTALPPAMTEDDLSTGLVESTLIDSIGGAYDWRGTGLQLPRKHSFTFRGAFELSDNDRFVGPRPIYLIDHSGNFIVDHAANRIVIDTPALALWRNVEALRSQTGTRQRLYRRREIDSFVDWKLCRLLKFGYVRRVEDAGAIANIELAFETQHAAWRSNTLTTVSAALPAGLLIPNFGSQTVNDALLRVWASPGAISSVAVSGPGISLSWTGSLGAGGTLEIDAGAQTVRIGGSDRYSGLVRSGAHTAAGWLPLPPGNTVIQVATDGAGTAEITFYEQNL